LTEGGEAFRTSKIKPQKKKRKRERKRSQGPSARPGCPRQGKEEGKRVEGQLLPTKRKRTCQERREQAIEET